MGAVIDIHVHTRRYSPCSAIDPERLIRQALKANLHGIVITEHHWQWSQDELDDLKEKAGEPNFLLFSGFEYTSFRGDILVYGIDAGTAAKIPPGLPPEEVVKKMHELGGICIGAHPTRMGLGFDENIFSLGLDGVEIASVNLKPHEQRLAQNIAEHAQVPATTASDAHRLADVGRYALEFTTSITSAANFLDALRGGAFTQVGDVCRLEAGT